MYSNSSIINNFKPTNQYLIAQHKERAYAGISPTLVSIKNAFGSKTLDTLIIAQLEDLNDFCGVSNKMESSQIIQLCWLVQTKYCYLKIAELLLFFFNFKMGMYGELYGSVDPIKITAALKKFDDERRMEISKIEAEERNKELQKPKRGISREAYEELKKKAKTSPEAFAKLFRSFPNGEVIKYWKQWLANPAEAEKYLIEFNLRKR